MRSTRPIASARTCRSLLYASLLADEDTRVAKHQGMQQEMQQIAAGFGEQVSFIEPEILKSARPRSTAGSLRSPA
jgi:oligoendopeptidase F